MAPRKRKRSDHSPPASPGPFVPRKGGSQQSLNELLENASKRAKLSTTKKTDPSFPSGEEATRTSNVQASAVPTSILVTPDEFYQRNNELDLDDYEAYGIPNLFVNRLASSDATSNVITLHSLPGMYEDLSMGILDKYNVATMYVKSGSKIQARVLTVTNHLSQIRDRNLRPNLVAMYAKGELGTKLTTVVELAKRHIGSPERGGTWYQYSRVERKMLLFNPNQENATKEGEASSKGKEGGPQDEELHEVIEGDAEAYQAQGLLPPGRDSLLGCSKVRAYVTFTVYLSRVPVPELAINLREHTNAGKE